MAATLASLFPEKAPELFAYQATIIRAERNYEAGRWVSYDRQYQWPEKTSTRLSLIPGYTMASIYRSCTILRCIFFLQDSHMEQQCLYVCTHESGCILKTPIDHGMGGCTWLPSLPSSPPWPVSAPPPPPPHFHLGALSVIMSAL